jgi:hypothetical protein
MKNSIEYIVFSEEKIKKVARCKVRVKKQNTKYKERYKIKKQVTGCRL